MAIGIIANLGSCGNEMNYTTNGLSITTSRVTITKGGICQKDGYCYIDLTFTTNFNATSSGGNTIITGFPMMSGASSKSLNFSGNASDVKVSNTSYSYAEFLLFICNSGQSIHIKDKYPISI